MDCVFMVLVGYVLSFICMGKKYAVPFYLTMWIIIAVGVGTYMDSGEINIGHVYLELCVVGMLLGRLHQTLAMGGK